MKTFYVLMAVILGVGAVTPALAYAPDCLDLGNCNWNLNKPFDLISKPFDVTLPGVFPLLFWGVIGIPIYLRAGWMVTSMYAVGVIFGFLAAGVVPINVEGTVANDLAYYAEIGVTAAIVVALFLLIMRLFGKQII